MKAKDYVRGKFLWFAVKWIAGSAIGAFITACALNPRDGAPESAALIGIAICLFMAVYPVRFIVVTVSELFDGKHLSQRDRTAQPTQGPSADTGSHTDGPKEA